MKPAPRALVPALLLICTLAAALAPVAPRAGVASARTRNARAATPPTQSSAAPLKDNAPQSPSTPEPHVFHLTVADREGNLVAGLGREALSAFEGGEPREIVSFRAGDVPASVAFLVDTSSSAFGESRGRYGHRRIDALKEAVSAFVEGANPSNEYFVTAFNKSPQVLLDGSTDARAVLAAFDRLASADLKGFTAMQDALYLSLGKLATRPTRKHVLVLLSDGMDNASRYTFAEVRRALKESDVIVYSVGVFVGDESQLVSAGREMLEELAGISGGAVFYPDDEAQMKAALTKVGVELRNQYEVAVAVPARAKGDGWRGLKFKLAEQHDARGRKLKLFVRARSGFYEPGAPRGR
jgi:Ca-activated chloride channel homolog